MASIKPYCNHTDCFANKDGRHCDILTKNPTSPCSFRKTQEQLNADRIKAHNRLVRMERLDLIDYYEYNRYRRGQW